MVHKKNLETQKCSHKVNIKPHYVQDLSDETTYNYEIVIIIAFFSDHSIYYIMNFRHFS